MLFVVAGRGRGRGFLEIIFEAVLALPKILNAT